MKVKVKSKYKSVKLPKLGLPKISMKKDEGWIKVIVGLALLGGIVYIGPSLCNCSQPSQLPMANANVTWSFPQTNLQ